MDEHNSMSPDEEVAKILSKDDGPSTSKRARLILNNQASCSRDEGEYSQSGPSQSRSIGHSRQIWDESSDSESSVESHPKVYPTVEAYLSSIPKFNAREHRLIPIYMDILGDNAKEIQTDLPRSSRYTDEEMEVLKKNFILSQFDFLIRENVRRTNKEARKKESGRLSLIKKPLATMPREEGYKSE